VEILRGTVLVVGALTIGLMAGVFSLYANAIMPGLRATNDRTFVGCFQAIDRAIINPAFLATFFGALVFPGMAAVLHISADERSVLPVEPCRVRALPLRRNRHLDRQRAAQRRDQGRRTCRRDPGCRHRSPAVR
jgi:hypothetical protein